MIEVMAVSAIAALGTALVNGAVGEMGKELTLSVRALFSRTLGPGTPFPADRAAWEAQAPAIHARIAADGPLARQWALSDAARSAPVLTPGAGAPPPPGGFTDRLPVLRKLRREAKRPAQGRPRAVLLWGPPGIGTSAVALYFAAEQHGRYPDGCFHVDVRDIAGGRAVEPVAVLQHVLRAMNVEPKDVPPTESGCQDLYRRLTNGRHALVVVDHATAAAQVRPLIPNTPGLFLLVVASGLPFALDARRVEVPPLKDRDAKALLRAAAGEAATARAKARIPQILERCAGNGYALRMAAAQLDAGRLDDGQHDDGQAEPLPAPQDAPRSSDPVHDTVRSVCVRLPSATVRMCRLTALCSLPEVTSVLAGRAADVSPDEAAPMLAEAAAAELLEPLGDGRYRFRPEAGRYLADTAGPELGVPECSAAVLRVLTWLALRGEHAAHAALPGSWRSPDAPEEGEPYADEAAGLAFLVAERTNLVRAIEVAAEYRHTGLCLRLGRVLWPLVLKAGHWSQALPALTVAARCADEHRPESADSAGLHFQLAHCYGQLYRWDEAEAEARTAVAHERAAGHLMGEASCIEYLGLLKLYRTDGRRAAELFAETGERYRRIVDDHGEDAGLRRALALVERHTGRALWIQDDLAEARLRLERARRHFEGPEGEPYNLARTLTDLAEVAHTAGDDEEALAHIGRAMELLPAGAAAHRDYLSNLRSRCETSAR